MRRLVLLIVTIIIFAAFAGCLGGDEDKKPKPVEMVRATGTSGTEGTVEASGQSNTVTASETVEILISDNNITGVSISVKVEDGDANTNPDQVSGSVEGVGEGDYNETLPSGPTPYTGTVNINAGEANNLPSKWVFNLEVECVPSDDQWPGPMMYRGYYDTGFSYNITITYSYLKPQV